MWLWLYKRRPGSSPSERGKETAEPAESNLVGHIELDEPRQPAHGKRWAAASGLHQTDHHRKAAKERLQAQKVSRSYLQMDLVRVGISAVLGHFGRLSRLGFSGYGSKCWKNISSLRFGEIM
jgi:hypothetical protein